MFQAASGSADSACRVRYLVGLNGGDMARFNKGSEEDTCEFLAAILQCLEAELAGSVEGTVLLNKFWGQEQIQRKILSNRLVSSVWLFVYFASIKVIPNQINQKITFEIDKKISIDVILHFPTSGEMVIVLVVGFYHKLKLRSFSF